MCSQFKEDSSLAIIFTRDINNNEKDQCMYWAQCAEDSILIL